MAPASFLLVLAAAFLHAAWNMLLKGGRGGAAFNALMLGSAALFYLPGFLAVWPRAPMPPRAWACVAASGTVHALYFALLARSYTRADLSLAYPVARGSGAALAALAGALFVGERPDAVGLAGTAAVLAGIALLGTGLTGARTGAGGGWLAWALGTGATIGAYSLVDKVGVSLAHPFVYIYLVMALAAAITVLGCLAPAGRAARRPGAGPGNTPAYRQGATPAGGPTHGAGWMALVSEWRRGGPRAAATGVLMAFTYLLVLVALQTSKLLYVAPLRESSVLFSMLLGRLVLREEVGPRRRAAGAAVCLGAALLAAAR